MNMKFWKRLFKRRDLPQRQRRQVVLSEASVQAITGCLAPEIRAQREGVAYLLGVSTGELSVVMCAIRPDAETAPGSFRVTREAMAKVIRAAARQELHVVGQVHTHPGMAYHSEGDVAGAKIAYTGYVSIVVPNYGRLLPALSGAAIYMFRAPQGFERVEESDVAVVPATLPGI